MAFNKRSDGILLKDLDSFRGMIPHLMKTRTESVIFTEHDLDVTDTIKYVKGHNRKKEHRDEKITLFYICLNAFVRTLALRPQLNRFVSGYRIYQRNEISLNFVAKKQLTDDAPEINVKISFDPYMTLKELPVILNDHIAKAKSEEGNINQSETAFLMKLPRFILRMAMGAFRTLDYWNMAPASMIKMDPLYCSLFCTNLTSLGIEAPFHHMFEWGNCGVFIALGKIKKEHHLRADGQVETRDIMTLRYSIDERIADGLYSAKALTLIKGFVEHPEKLALRPEIPEEYIRELRLKPYES